MTTRNTLIVIIALALVMTLASLALSPRLAEPMATHWGPTGQADGWGSRFTGLYLMPLMVVGLGLLLLFLPMVDPLKSNIALFRKPYNAMIVIVAVFLAYLHGLMLAFNLGVRFSMNTWMLPAMGVLFFVIGWLLGKAKRNWFIGIRTPWTLSSDTVWAKTHQRGGLLFKVGGALIFVSAFLPGSAAFMVVMVVALGTALYLLLYSYILYRQEQNS